MKPQKNNRLSVSFVCEDTVWQKHKGLQQAVRQALKQSWAGISTQRASLTICLSNDPHVQTLNKQFRGKDKPTNVLSFPSPDTLGDLILAYETVAREAEQEGKNFLDHVIHLSLHGTLHLLGYDHETQTDATKMEGLEIMLLEKLGIPNPYASMPE